MCRWEIQTYGLIIFSPDGRVVVWVMLVWLVVLGIVLLSWIRYVVTVVDTALAFTRRFQGNHSCAVCIIACRQWHLILCFAWHTPQRPMFDSRPVFVNVWCTKWHLDFFPPRSTLFFPCQYYFTSAHCGWLGYVRRWQTVVLCWGWRNSWAPGMWSNMT